MTGIYDSATTNLYLYLNGALVATTNTGVVPASGTGYPFTLGRNAVGANSYLDGTLDDARVYNRALSAADIKTLYYSTGGGSGDINTGLIGYWKLDEGSGTLAADSTGTGNTGTLQNSPTWTTSGKINDALTFNGTNQYVTATDAPFQISGSWTVATWVNLASLPSSGNAATLLAKDSGGGCTNYSLAVDNGVFSAGLGWAVYFNNGACGANIYAKFTTSISTATWYHVVAVFDSVAKTETVYLNGFAVATNATGANVPTVGAGSPLYLASEGGNLRLTGTLDDTRVYSRALSASDVLTLYNSTATACASPVGYAGDVQYNNGSNHVLQFCDGAAWQPMGKVPGAGGAGCSGPTGSEGDMRYNGDKTVMEYCDGTNWQAVGGGPIGGPTTGLVGWWKLDETSGTSAADSSGNGNTGTLTNGPTWTAAGADNGALTLVKASSQYVNVPDAASLQLSGSWTVSAWVNPTTVPTSGGGVKVITKDDASNNSNYGISIVNNTSGCTGLGFRIFFDPGANSCYTTTITPGTWYHVVGVWDSVAKNLMVYLSGALVNTQNIPSNVPTSAPGGPLELGGEAGVSAYLDGTLDDARVYNRALSAAEIMRLYKSTGGQ